MTLEEYKKAYPDPDDAAPGWDAIDAPLKAIYGEQEPMHWGTVISARLGGPDPIDGIRAAKASGADALGHGSIRTPWRP